jgi:two-component system, OmpR family, phosphate regulon sensor histidine kinase PhoR
LPTEADPKIYQSKLLWQVWGLLCALVLISALSIGYFAAQQVASDARAAIEESLAHQVQLLKQFYNPLILQEAALPVIQSEQRITILGPDGTVLSDNREDAGLMENHLKRPEIIAASAIGLGIAQRYSTTLEQDMLYVALALGSPDAPTGYVRVSTPLTSIEQKVNAMRLQVNLLTGAFTFIAILIGLYFARRIVLPVLRMTQASALMASGEFSLRLDEGHANELGSLARALNKLAAGTQAKIEEVAARQNELTVVLQGMTEGIIALNADQAVIQMNRSAATILNLEQSSVLNKPFQSLSIARDLGEIVTAGFTATGPQFQTMTLGGRRIEVSGLRLGDASVEGMILVLRDTTELQRLERVRTDFVANASHELKTPISALRGFVDTVIDDTEMPTETRRSFLVRSQQQIHRLASIVQDLLQLSRLDTGYSPDSDKTLVLSDVVHQVYLTKITDAEIKQVQLIYETSPDCQQHRIQGRADDLALMLSNLIDNAIKYSDHGGTVSLTLAMNGEGFIRFNVTDQGVGIPAEEHDKIFERFYRVDPARSRNKGGTGLGLSIVKHVVERYQGRIKLVSRPGQGASFSVTFPILQSDPTR